MDFGRLITAMVTPFDAEGKIDWEATGRLIDHLIDEQGTDSIVVSGTTGESPTLDDDEKLELFRFAVKRVAGRVPVIAGTGSNDTAHSIRLTKEAEATGVDGILLVAPYYNRPSQEGLYLHFRAVAEATKLPVMIYNVPGRTGVNVSADTTLRLAQMPNIVATKDCAPTEQLTAIAAEAPSHFRVYSGDDSQTLPAMAVGAHGIVSVASHVVGRELKRMIEAHVEGRTAEAARLHQKLSPIFRGLFHCPHPVPNPVPVKYALYLRGVIPSAGVRLPLAPLTDAEAAFVRNLLDIRE